MPKANNSPQAELFDYDNPDWYKNFLLHMRYSINMQAYENFAGIVSGFLNKSLQFPPLAQTDGDDRLTSDIDQLKTQGFCRVGQLLDADQVAETRQYIDAQKIHDGWDRVPGEHDVAACPQDISVGHFQRNVMFEVPHLPHVASDPRVLARVAGFLQAPPTIQYFALWWSLAGRPAPKDAQLFHIDRHCYRFLKLFVYLTDVEMDAGPHVYVRESGYFNETMQRLGRLQREQPENAERFGKMINSQRKDDGDVADFFGSEKITYMTGRAGEAFLVNTAGFHKGLLPTNTDRLVFQALYTMLPTIKDVVEPFTLPAFHDAHQQRFSGTVPEPYARYANRLVIND